MLNVNSSHRYCIKIFIIPTKQKKNQHRETFSYCQVVKNYCYPQAIITMNNFIFIYSVL